MCMCASSPKKKNGLPKVYIDLGKLTHLEDPGKLLRTILENNCYFVTGSPEELYRAMSTPLVFLIFFPRTLMCFCSL